MSVVLFVLAWLLVVGGTIAGGAVYAVRVGRRDAFTCREPFHGSCALCGGGS